MINNFNVIDNFLQFKEGTFYKFELLVRNTDGYNVLFPKGCSNTNKNILIKSWYASTKDYYEKIKHEMITLADLTGARLYVTLDRKDNVKLVQNLIHRFTDTLCSIGKGQKPSIKSISKMFASETSKVENSSKETKTIMFDADTKDDKILQLVRDYIWSKKTQPYTLETKKGYHVFCYRKFDCSDWLETIVENNFKHTKFEDAVAEKDYKTSFKSKLQDVVSVRQNELGLVYHPMKTEEKIYGWLDRIDYSDWINTTRGNSHEELITTTRQNQIKIYDKILAVIEPYLGGFTGYNEEKHCFDIVQAVEELIKEEYEREQDVFK